MEARSGGVVGTRRRLWSLLASGGPADGEQPCPSLPDTTNGARVPLAVTLHLNSFFVVSVRATGSGAARPHLGSGAGAGPAAWRARCSAKSPEAGNLRGAGGGRGGVGAGGGSDGGQREAEDRMGARRAHQSVSGSRSTSSPRSISRVAVSPIPMPGTRVILAGMAASQASP